MKLEVLKIKERMSEKVFLLLSVVICSQVHWLDTRQPQNCLEIQGKPVPSVFVIWESFRKERRSNLLRLNLRQRRWHCQCQTFFNFIFLLPVFFKRALWLQSQIIYNLSFHRKHFKHSFQTQPDDLKHCIHESKHSICESKHCNCQLNDSKYSL